MNKEMLWTAIAFVVFFIVFGMMWHYANVRKCSTPTAKVCVKMERRHRILHFRHFPRIQGYDYCLEWKEVPNDCYVGEVK